MPPQRLSWTFLNSVLMLVLIATSVVVAPFPTRGAPG
jgi:hypothetical protein